MALPPPKVLPKASALFLPYEIRLYKHWRQSALGIADENDDDILLPNAFEYMDFEEWRAKQRASLDGFSIAEEQSPDPAVAGFVLAERCGHPLHPGDPRLDAQRKQEGEVEKEDEEQDKIAWCSMCLLQIHLKLLAELWDKWSDSGGPWRVLLPGSTGEGFQTSMRAYYKRKTDLVNEVDNLEYVARLEAAWETAHPAADVEVAHAYSAKTAVEVYAKGVQFPDTPEDTRHRPSAFYSRSCTAYDPGSPYRCPDDEGWAETSFTTSWEYNVRQCRTLLCDTDPSQPNVTYRELTDDWSKDNLIKGIEEWFGQMEEDWKGPWINILLTTTDMFIVWRGPPYVEGCENDFNNWDRAETLVGTNLEAHARRIGDITGETDTEGVEGEIMEDFLDQNSFASDSDSDEEEDEFSDPMDLEEDDDEDMAIGIAGGDHQPGQTALGEDTGTGTCHNLDEASGR